MGRWGRLSCCFLLTFFARGTHESKQWWFKQSQRCGENSEKEWKGRERNGARASLANVEENGMRFESTDAWASKQSRVSLETIFGTGKCEVDLLFHSSLFKLAKWNFLVLFFSFFFLSIICEFRVVFQLHVSPSACVFCSCGLHWFSLFSFFDLFLFWSHFWCASAAPVSLWLLFPVPPLSFSFCFFLSLFFSLLSFSPCVSLFFSSCGVLCFWCAHAFMQVQVNQCAFLLFFPLVFFLFLSLLFSSPFSVLRPRFSTVPPFVVLLPCGFHTFAGLDRWTLC